MNTMTKTILLAAVLALLTAGCYTKLYRPEGMAMDQRGPYDQIYNRYDSTAIDTTLTPPEYSYPEDDYGWYYWGQSRYPRWGFDFWNYSPGYYWSYDGFYDYYGTPWWSRYSDPWYHWGWSPPSEPQEPPSQRNFGRRERPSGSGGDYAPPPSGGSGGGYAPPQSTPPPASPSPQQTPDQSVKKQTPPPPSGDQNQRSGRRGR